MKIFKLNNRKKKNLNESSTYSAYDLRCCRPFNFSSKTRNGKLEGAICYYKLKLKSFFPFFPFSRLMWFRGKRNFHFELAWKHASKFAENSIHISCKQIHTMKMGLSPIKKKLH